jgi:hypothetical protein
MSKSSNNAKLAVLKIWLADLKSKTRPRKQKIVVVDLDED